VILTSPTLSKAAPSPLFFHDLKLLSNAVIGGLVRALPGTQGDSLGL
jgi:hypothetical protein